MRPNRRTRLVVGLGNPGERYARTRHNVGFWVVDELGRRWKAAFVADAANRLGCFEHASESICLIQPQMYMNRSGEALTQLAPPACAEALVVIHDDLDLDCAAVRVKQGGGTGGHRGLESLRTCFGPDFVRVRVGIGRPLDRTQVIDYVLSPFDATQTNLMDAAVTRAADAVEVVLREGASAAMNRFNRRCTPAPAMPC